MPGLPGIEPSWASVEPCSVTTTTTTTTNAADANNQSARQHEQSVVHGVLYALTPKDFATICRTEGVPFSYVLHKCRVFPYLGDGKSAGLDEYHNGIVASSSPPSSSSSFAKAKDNDANGGGISAYTLLAGPMVRRRGDIPPSRSYVNVLIRGAKEFALDESYFRKLEGIKVGKTWIGDGLAEGMLRRAANERRGQR